MLSWEAVWEPRPHRRTASRHHALSEAGPRRCGFCAGLIGSGANSHRVVAVEQPQLQQYMDVVREVARSLAARLRSDTVELEELEADGFEGLVKAMRDYDSAKGPLIPYIVLRCRGAMIDGLRRRMWISRTQRAVGVTEPTVIPLDHEVAGGMCVADVISDPSPPTAD